MSMPIARTGNGARGRGLAPEEDGGDGEDGGAHQYAHEEVDVAVCVEFMCLVGVDWLDMPVVYTTQMSLYLSDTRVPELEPDHLEERCQRAHHQPEADDAAARDAEDLLRRRSFGWIYVCM